MSKTFGYVEKSVVKYCKFDNGRCYRDSCDIIDGLGSVVSCLRRRGFHSRFTRRKNVESSF
jgi:hypothetical protein